MVTKAKTNKDENLTTSAKTSKEEIFSLPYPQEVITLDGPQIPPLNSKPKHLAFPPEVFKQGYDFNVIPYMEKQFNNTDYISWSSATTLLRMIHPTLIIKHVVHYEQDGSAYIDMWLQDAVLGLTTEHIYFPVTDKKNEAIISPNCRQISDAIQRGKTKLVASTTGIGLRIWSREGIDLNKKNDNQHPLYVGLKAINTLENTILSELGELPEEYRSPNFGDSIKVLRDTYRYLSAYLTENKNTEAQKEQVNTQEVGI